jgi:hypothetical protein
VFNRIQERRAAGDSGESNLLGGRDLQDTAWTMIKMARTARKQVRAYV